MNPFGEARKLRDKLLQLDVAAGIYGEQYAESPRKIFATTDQNDALEEKLPAVAIEIDTTSGEKLSRNVLKPVYHSATIHCIASAQNISFDQACDASVALSNEVMKQMAGTKISVKEDGISYAGYQVGSEKARAVILDCEIAE